MDAEALLAEVRALRAESHDQHRDLKARVEKLSDDFNAYARATNKELGALRERSGVFGFLGGVVAFLGVKMFA